MSNTSKGKKRLTKDQKQMIQIVLAYHRMCEVVWDKAKKESGDLACQMIEDIILNNE